MSKRMPAMRFGKRSSPSIFDLYDERIQTSPYSNNPVFKKRKVPSVYGLVHFLNSKMKPNQGHIKFPSTLNEVSYYLSNIYNSQYSKSLDNATLKFYPILLYK